MLTLYLSMVETAEERSLFEKIYYTYRKQMLYVAKGIINDENLAEDALQDAFLGIAKQITRFQNLPDNEVKAYVLTVARHAAINLSKQEQKISQHQISFEEAILVSHHDQVLDEQIYKETYQILMSEISKLPPVQQDILLLKYSEALSCEQIGIALGKKSSTVRKELSRARQALKENCRKEGLEIEN